LIHFLRGAGGKFFIPEVLQHEYLRQAVAALEGWRADIDENFDRVERLIGHRDAYEVPTDNQAREAVHRRLAEIEALTVTRPMTDDLLVAAARRSLGKRPPATKNDHGMGDCVIWESILSLGEGADVRLVSRDKKALVADNSLNPDLEREATQRGLNVIGYSTLEGVLAELQKGGAPPYDTERAILALNAALASDHTRLIARWGLSSVGPRITGSFDPFYTEDAHRLYIRFWIRYNAGTANFDGREYLGENSVDLAGSFDWYPDTGRLDALQIESEHLIASDGSVIVTGRTIHAPGAHLVVGRGVKKFEMKKPLFRKCTAAAHG
jgi:hypothetical protein